MPADPRPSLGDTVWRMLQGKRLKAAERAVMARTLKVLNGRAGVEEMMATATREVYLPGESILRAGELGAHMFLVLDGEVDVVRDGAIVDRIRHGEIFGEIGLLDGAPRSATVTAVGRVVAVRIPREAVDEGMRERLWSYAAERRFFNLPGLPIAAGRERDLWYQGARHSTLQAGEYQVSAPWLFVYYGEIEVGGDRAVAPAFIPGGTVRCADTVRLALLQDP